MTYRLTMAGLLSVAVIFSWIGVSFVVVLGFVLITATALIVAMRRRPAWRAELVELRRDPVRFRRETRRDLVLIATFLILAVVISALLANAGVIGS
jgi:hypothetical protein